MKQKLLVREFERRDYKSLGLQHRLNLTRATKVVASVFKGFVIESLRMTLIETFLVSQFGKKALSWIQDRGARFFKEHKATAGAREILREFLLDTGAEERIPEYIAKLNALSAPANKAVKSVHETISRTRRVAKKKTAKKKTAKRRTTKAKKPRKIKKRRVTKKVRRR